MFCFATGMVKEMNSVDSVKPEKFVPKRKECKYFFAENSCHFGEFCRYSHTTAEAAVNRENFVVRRSDSQFRKPYSRPIAAAVSKNDIGTQKQCDIRNSEINYFVKRFRQIQCTYNGSSYVTQFEYQITDPEWVFDVKALVLELTIPEHYPCAPLSVDLVSSTLPTPFITHFEEKIDEFVKDKFVAADKRNSYIGVGKTLISWLDHNIFDLFVDGLRKTKLITDAEKEGISLHETNCSELDVSQVDQDSNVKQKEMDSNEVKVVCSNDVTEVNLASQLETNMQIVNESKQQLSKANAIEVRVSWKNLNGNIATLGILKMELCAKCAKCTSSSFLICFVDRLLISRCQKCSNRYSIFMSSQIVHENSNVIALLELDGCIPVDCVLPSSKFNYACLKCNNECSTE
ncbi:unnamed protein product, partial [Thelazia callipaeda]|uniref:C3H1-type domain-containing protein n=1 Tax=Thelazia callipaeda TaxID=103827 RepID=A0A0N5D7N8_THECL